MEAINVDKLSKTYKDQTQGLSELSLSVKQGEVFTLLGKNGAGKSTLINILTTFLAPTSGRAIVLGKDLTEEAAKIRREIACVAQKVSIDEHLTLRENMLFQGRLYKMSTQSIEEKMKQLIGNFGLENYVSKRVSAYSGGVKRRLDIAMSLMSSPQILFLDEPTVGMDIESRKAMWDIVRRISIEFQTTVFLTTHYLEEADILSNTICIMQSGHEIIQDTPTNLKKHTMQQRVRTLCRTPEDAAKLCGFLGHEAFVQSVLRAENAITVLVEDAERDYNYLVRFVLEKGIQSNCIEIVQPNLDDVFSSLTHEGSV